MLDIICVNISVYIVTVDIIFGGQLFTLVLLGYYLALYELKCDNALIN